jgi:protein gp37
MFRQKRAFGQDPTQIIRSKERTFNAPLSWREPKRIFVCSWSDFFHEAADEWREGAWRIMAMRPRHTYIIPTKRIERAADHLPWGQGKPWNNVWLLASVSTQREAGEAIIRLLAIRAAARGVSLEPLLGEINLCGLTDGHVHYNALTPGLLVPECLDWVIVAGESGGPPDRALVEWWPKAGPNGNGAWRPVAYKAGWVRSIRDQCQAAGVPFFWKGWGGPKPTSGGRLLDGREHNEFPEGR